MTPYRNRKGARPWNDAGQLLCDRCGHVAQGWPLARPDSCGLGVSCIRQPADVLASWRRYGRVTGDDARGGDPHARNPRLDADRGGAVDPRDASQRPAAAVEVTPRPQGLVYLLHFTTPYKHARHYLGATGLTLDERVAAHRGGEFKGESLGRPAKLITALLNAGGDFIVARTWQTIKRKDAFLLERQLKKRGSRARLCPVCTPGVHAAKEDRPCDE